MKVREASRNRSRPIHDQVAGRATGSIAAAVGTNPSRSSTSPVNRQHGRHGNPDDEQQRPQQVRSHEHDPVLRRTPRRWPRGREWRARSVPDRAGRTPQARLSLSRFRRSRCETGSCGRDLGAARRCSPYSSLPNRGVNRGPSMQKHDRPADGTRCPAARAAARPAGAMRAASAGPRESATRARPAKPRTANAVSHCGTMTGRVGRSPPGAIRDAPVAHPSSPTRGAIAVCWRLACRRLSMLLANSRICLRTAVLILAFALMAAMWRSTRSRPDRAQRHRVRHLDAGSERELRFRPTLEVPYVDQQAFGWRPQGRGTESAGAMGRAAAAACGTRFVGGRAESPNVTVSDDGRTATTFGMSMPDDEFIGNVWYVSAGDPTGDCRISVEFADGRKASFRFTIAAPKDGRPPASAGEVI